MAQPVPSPDTAPEQTENPVALGGETAAIPEEARQLEREMGVLIGDGRVISAGHFDEIRSSLEALEADLGGATLSYLRGKLDVLSDYSVQIMREMLGFDCPRFKPDESEARAQEQISRYLELEKKYLG